MSVGERSAGRQAAAAPRAEEAKAEYEALKSSAETRKTGIRQKLEALT